jgi:hypothetical protein
MSQEDKSTMKELLNELRSITGAPIVKPNNGGNKPKMRFWKHEK